MAPYIVTLVLFLASVAGDAADLHGVWRGLAQAASVGAWPLWMLDDVSADWTGLAITGTPYRASGGTEVPCYSFYSFS